MGIDGSLGSHAAARWALAHARSGDTVTLMHVWRPSPAAVETGLARADDDAGARTLVRHELARLAALPRDEGVVLASEVVHGDARTALCDSGADVLVVGAGTHGSIVGALVGSVSSYLAHHALGSLVIVSNPAARSTSK